MSEKEKSNKKESILNKNDKENKESILNTLNEKEKTIYQLLKRAYREGKTVKIIATGSYQPEIGKITGGLENGMVELKRENETTLLYVSDIKRVKVYEKNEE